MNITYAGAEKKKSNLFLWYQILNPKIIQDRFECLNHAFHRVRGQ